MQKQILADTDDPLRGAFTCELTLSPEGLADPNFPGKLERDRMYIAAQPGILHKHIPFSFDSDGSIKSGGRYLLDTFENAQALKNFLENDFILDGTKFFDRSVFLDHDCHAWAVMGQHDFGNIHTSQVVLRTERWVVPVENQQALLKQRWHVVMDEAAQRGLTSAWLLYNQQEHLVALVYFADRVVPKDPTVPDFVSLGVLGSAQPLGHIFDDQGWTKVLDRTQWVLTIWFPFLLGDHGEPAVWPNSPPFPEAFCGDGVCSVSRGESNATCPGDCPPQCGDGICQVGEDTTNCPGDCRIVWK
jgi:hypothetical protein